MFETRSLSVFFVMTGCAFVFGLSSFACAQGYEPPQEAFVDLPDDAVLAIMKDVRAALPNAKISETETVGEETPEELIHPLLTREQGETVLERGIISVTAEWCGLDWVGRSYTPFMADQRAQGRSPKQMAYIGMLHGYSMGIMQEKFAEVQCGPEQIERVSSYLYQR